MQQPISRSTDPTVHHTHTNPVSESKAESNDMGWKVAVAVVGGYLTVVTIVGLGILLVRSLGVLLGAYNPQIGW